jgi:hypothetical protein
MADEPIETGVTIDASTASEDSPKRVGRPPKALVASKKKGNIAKRGRPPGEAAAMAEFKARLITSPKSKKVLEKIFDAALDDDHKAQSAAWKLIVERLAPLSSFEKGTGGKASVTINISGIGQSVTLDGSTDDNASPMGNADIDDVDYEAIDD